MSILIAVDHGNYAIKTPNFSFISGLMELSGKATIHETDILEYGNKLWALSNTRIKYMRDKTLDDRFFILTLFAVGKELEKMGIDSPIEEIDLAVGLPPEHYSTLREKFKDYFCKRGKVNFVYNNRPVSVIIQHVFVFPQAYAAAAPHAQTLVETPRIFLVDIGGYTSDVLLMRDGSPDLEFCRSLEAGVITMYNPIIAQVNAKHDMLIDDGHINAVLQNKRTSLPEDVQASIRAAVQQHANELVNQLRELRVDLRANPAIFIGGGALLFEEYLKKSPLVRQAEFEKDPKANAIGYKMLAARQLKRLSEQKQCQTYQSPFTGTGGMTGENI
jgi:plasmid segregation protein ParM